MPLLAADDLVGLVALAGQDDDVEGVKGRAEIVPVPWNYTVLIDYAVTPDAIENILTTVRGFAKADNTRENHFHGSSPSGPSASGPLLLFSDIRGHHLPLV